MTRLLNRIFLAVTALAVALLGWCSLTGPDGGGLGPSVVLEQPSGRLIDEEHQTAPASEAKTVSAPDPASSEAQSDDVSTTEGPTGPDPGRVDQSDASIPPVDPVAVADSAQSPGPTNSVEPTSPSVAATAEPQDSGAPRFDIVRVDADGQTVIAGKAAPGEKVEVLIDGTVVGDAVADEQGAFVAVIFADLSDQAQHLQLRTRAPISAGDVVPTTPEAARQTTAQSEESIAPIGPAAGSATTGTAPHVAEQVVTDAAGQRASAGVLASDTVPPNEARTPEVPKTATGAAEQATPRADVPSDEAQISNAGTLAPDPKPAEPLTTQTPVADVSSVAEVTRPEIPAATVETAKPAADPASEAKPGLTTSVTAEEQSTPDQSAFTETPGALANSQGPAPAAPEAQPTPTETTQGQVAREPILPEKSTENASVTTDTAASTPVAPQTAVDSAPVVAPVTQIGDLALASPPSPDQNSLGAGLGVSTGGGSTPRAPLPSTGAAVLGSGTSSPKGDAPLPGASVPAEAPGTQFVLSAPVIILPSSQPDAAPTLVQPQTEELAVLQPGGGQVDGIVLDRITYGETGDVQLSGRARGGRTIRIYGNAISLDTIRANGEGAWSWSLAPERAREIKLFRFDEIAADGSVSSRIETPFAYSVLSPQVLRERRVVVQKGDMLWRIAEQFYGEGLRFSLIYGANEALIRDPDLIYPGQVFSIPELVDAQ